MGVKAASKSSIELTFTYKTVACSERIKLPPTKPSLLSHHLLSHTPRNRHPMQRSHGCQSHSYSAPSARDAMVSLLTTALMAGWAARRNTGTDDGSGSAASGGLLGVR